MFWYGEACSEVAVRLSAGLMLRAKVARDFARQRAPTHRHYRLELFADLGLDSFHLDIVRPLGFRVGGRHLVHHPFFSEG